MRRILTILLAASVVIAGCRSTIVPSPVLEPAATAGSNDTLAKLTNLWILRPSHQPQTYHSISQTTIHELSSLLPRQNAIEISTNFTILLDQTHTPLIISGRVDTAIFRPQNQPLPENKAFTLPLLFEGELASPTLTITVKNPQAIDGTCSPPISSILGDLHGVVTVFPSRLTPSSTWNDSTVVATCTAGGIPTIRKTNQLFRVVGERAFNTTRALFIQRLDSTYVNGDGTLSYHQVHLEGVGTGRANIYINPITAVILRVEFSENLEITIINSGRAQHFIQEVTQKLERTN